MNKFLYETSLPVATPSIRPAIILGLLAYYTQYETKLRSQLVYILKFQGYIYE